jgi:flagellar basal-body rod protein FlgG
MKAQQTQVDTIANNIANSQHVRLQEERAQLPHAALPDLSRARRADLVHAARKPDRLQVGSGTEVSGSSKIFDQGVLEPTSGRFDLALQGEGFFRVRLPSGEQRYTRDGAFHLDGQGTLVTTEGYILDGAPIDWPRNAITVTVRRRRHGLHAEQRERAAPRTPASCRGVARSPNPAGLKAQGGNLFSETPASGVATQNTAGLNGTGTIKAGLPRSAPTWRS